MSLPLTPQRLAAVYAALRAFPPFCHWGLPAAEKVEFKVSRARTHDACYQPYRWNYDEHGIEVSEARNGYFNTVAESVAHEMIHLHQRLARTETKSEHNAEFRRIAAAVCRRYGWDFKQFI